MKRELCSIGMLTSFGADPAGGEIFRLADHGRLRQPGHSIFFGYCAIILVAQVFSALVALRALVGCGTAQRGTPARDLPQRPGQPQPGGIIMGRLPNRLTLALACWRCWRSPAPLPQRPGRWRAKPASAVTPMPRP